MKNTGTPGDLEKVVVTSPAFKRTSTLEMTSLLRSNVVSRWTEEAIGYRMWVSMKSLSGTRAYQKHLQFNPQDSLASSAAATGKAHLSGAGGIKGGGCCSG